MWHQISAGSFARAMIAEIRSTRVDFTMRRVSLISWFDLVRLMKLLAVSERYELRGRMHLSLYSEHARVDPT